MSSPSVSSRKGKHKKRAQLTSVPVTSSGSKSRASSKSPSAKAKPKARPSESATFGRQIPLDVDTESSSSSDDDDIIHISFKKSSPAVAATSSKASSPRPRPAVAAASSNSPRARSADRKRGATGSSNSSSHPSPVRPRTLHVDTSTTTRPLEDDDSGDDSIPPTTKELSCLCWKCHVTLKMPNSPREFCKYALHVHPILQVPVCIVCSEEIAKHQMSSQQETASTSSSENDDDICHGCAEMPWEDLLCCDQCPRQFCNLCVAQAYGGGTKGLKAADQLTKEEDDWMCLVCDPQPALQKLQKELDAKKQSSNPDLLSQDSTSSNAPLAPAAGRRRSVEEILEELDWVEGEHKAQEQWDDPKALAAKRKEIAEEIRQENPNMSSAELDAKVEDEMARFVHVLAEHDKRLGDMTVALQEELEVFHGMDLAKVYQKCLGAKIHEDDDGEEEVDPEWKRKADEEIRKRDMANKQTTLPNISSPSVYEREDFGDVEDLLTRPDDEVDRDCLGEGFRSTMDRPTQKQIDLAMKAEDEALAEKKIRIRHRVDAEADKQEDIEAENLVSQHGSDGVTRVRRDTFVALLEARPKKKPPRPPSPEEKTESSGDEAPPNAAVAQLQQPDHETFPQPLALAGELKPVPDDGCVDLSGDTPSPFVHRKPKPARAAQKPKKALDFEFESESDDASACQVVNPDDEYYESTDPIYALSDLVLSSPKSSNFKSEMRVKHIAVCTSLEKNLKPHQKEGVQFMWRNACIDLNVRTSKDQKLREDKDVGGCILAHSMGLGKSLTTISLLHTLMNHPGLEDQKRSRGMVFTAMLVVPVNTLASWKTEFQKWTRELQPSILVFELGEHKSASRGHVIDQWFSKGGVLLVSKDSFAREAKSKPSMLSPGPDVVVVDEAHLCLSNKDTAVYKALDQIRTKRRILLTGSPFQNNAKEYFTMIQWIRPEALACSESEFETTFSKPIMAGLPLDATSEERHHSVLKSTQLNKILDPYVHRRDEHVLRAFLPELSQVVLHIRQSKLQTKLYRALKRYEDQNDITNCFRRFHNSRPIHNHPACLLMQSRNEEDDGVTSEPWWQNIVQKLGEDKLKSAHHGAKILLLLHILTHSVLIGDKTVVFANCLKTLDFIQEVLSRPCWSDHVKSLKSAFPGTKLGGWSHGNDYLRIDGGTDSAKRGTLIAKFNKVDKVHLFLISAKAGGVGITLSSANRVVLFDNHFNPTVTTQAIFRCYRFGQTKPVFAYRFMTEGTGEEKIYSRSVNKSGLALRVVDGKSYQGAFTEEELRNLVLNDTWVQCENCEKWRMLPHLADDTDLPDRWFCTMNSSDLVNNTCAATEKDARWYHSHFRLQTLHASEIVGKAAESAAGGDDNDDNISTATDDSEAKKEAMAKKDPILTKLLESESKTASNLAKYYFHEALLEEREADGNLLDAPEDESALDRKPASKPSASTSVEGAPPEKVTFKQKVEAHKRKDMETEGSSDASKNNSAKIGQPKNHASTGSTEKEKGSSAAKKQPATSSEGRSEKKSISERETATKQKARKRESAGDRVAKRDRESSAGPRSSPSTQQAKIKKESIDGSDASLALKRKRGHENGPGDGSSTSGSARKRKSRSRRKKSPMKASQEVVELLSSDEE